MNSKTSAVTPTDEQIDAIWHSSTPSNFEARSFARAVLQWAASAQSSQWQSMETAPQTGEAILVWCPEDQNTFQVCWGEDDGWVYFGPFSHRLCDGPTHWMPLPPPPL